MEREEGREMKEGERGREEGRERKWGEGRERKGTWRKGGWIEGRESLVDYLNERVKETVKGRKARIGQKGLEKYISNYSYNGSNRKRKRREWGRRGGVWSGR